MKDLTQGSIVRHILNMAPPIVAGMITMMICQLVDLYFVAGLGEAAVAGVAAAGNLAFLINGLMQVLGVGTVSLIAHAVGRKDRADANLVFNQALGLAAGCGLLTWVIGSALAGGYMRMVAADEATVAAGTTYLLWLMPALALQFGNQVVGAALRATGIVNPTMIVQALAVAINIALAPVLITGWGTGHALGVAGAGLATSLAMLAAVLMLWMYFRRLERYVGFNLAQLSPQLPQWGRILNVGLPAGGDFAIVFIWVGVIYYVLRDFGAAAQAGFGIGTRVLGLIQMPALAIALSAGPIAGQNFGAGNFGRVKETFVRATMIVTLVMVAITIVVQWQPGVLLSGFGSDAETLAVATLFLQMISLNLVAQGLIFASSSMFQGLGNTKPVLLSSGARLITYALPVLWLSARPGFRIEYAWYVSNMATTLQAALSLWLLHLEFRKRLAPLKSVLPAE